MYLSKVDLPLRSDHALLDFFVFACWISLSLLFLLGFSVFTLGFFAFSLVVLRRWSALIYFVFLWLFREEKETRRIGCFKKRKSLEEETCVFFSFVELESFPCRFLWKSSLWYLSCYSGIESFRLEMLVS